MPPHKTKQDANYEDIKLELAEIKQLLAERRHLDEDIKTIKHELEGNGKPGWKSIRDKVLSWEVKVNVIILAVLGDLVFRVIILAASAKP